MTAKVPRKDECYYQHTTNELELGCFHHFANDSSELKRLKKIVVVHYNCVHGQKFSQFIWALLFTPLQLTLVFVLGFRFWFLHLGFVFDFVGLFG